MQQVAQVAREGQGRQRFGAGHRVFALGALHLDFAARTCGLLVDLFEAALGAAL